MIGDDITAALPELREQALSLMVDACVVERPAGRVRDPVTLEYTDVWITVYPEGPCRVQIVTVGTPSELVGAPGRDWIVQEAVVQLPVQAVQYRSRDRVTVTASAEDPALAGAVLTVTGQQRKTHAVMRRLNVQEVAP